MFPMSSTSHETVSGLGLGYTITSLTLLLIITFFVYKRLSGKSEKHASTKMLRNIPWKDGIALFSDEQFHRDADSFLIEGFKRFGDIFSFRFRTVSSATPKYEFASQTKSLV